MPKNSNFVWFAACPVGSYGPSGEYCECACPCHSLLWFLETSILIIHVCKCEYKYVHIHMYIYVYMILLKIYAKRERELRKELISVGPMSKEEFGEGVSQCKEKQDCIRICISRRKNGRE